MEKKSALIKQQYQQLILDYYNALHQEWHERYPNGIFHVQKHEKHYYQPGLPGPAVDYTYVMFWRDCEARWRNRCRTDKSFGIVLPCEKDWDRYKDSLTPTFFNGRVFVTKNLFFEGNKGEFSRSKTIEKAIKKAKLLGFPEVVIGDFMILYKRKMENEPQ